MKIESMLSIKTLLRMLSIAIMLAILSLFLLERKIAPSKAQLILIEKREVICEEFGGACLRGQKFIDDCNECIISNIESKLYCVQHKNLRYEGYNEIGLEHCTVNFKTYDLN